MKISILLFLLLSIISSYPQERYSAEEIYNMYGIPNCLIQDNKGYIWCGTSEGFSRYDGFAAIPVYNGDPVTTLSEDEEGNIWAGTINGEIVKYNRATGKIQTFNLRPDPLFYYNPIEFNKLPSKYLYYKNTSITSILINKHVVLLGTWGSGLFIFNKLKENVQEHLFSIADEKSLPGNYITSVIKGESDKIFCGSFDAGIIEIELKKKEYKSSCNNYNFTSLCFSGNDIYAGTMQGVLKLSPDLGSKEIIVNEPVTDISFDKKIFAAIPGKGISIINGANAIIEDRIYDSLNPGNNSFTSLLVDRTGIIWTSNYKGLTKWKQKNELFTNYKLPGITSFVSDSSQNIYVGTIRNGLNIFSPSKKPNIINIDEIKDLLYSSSGRLYIAASNKLLLLEKNNNSKVILNNVNISTLAELPDGSIWAGTAGEGIIQIPSNKSSKIIYYRKSEIYPGSIPDNYIKKIFVSDNNLWGFSKEGFLFRFIKNEDSFVSWKIKSNRTNILSAFADPDYIYLGTYGEGIYKFNKQEEKFYPLQYDGLRGFRNVFNILKDRTSNLWAVTESGILRFNEGNHQLFNYTQNDGIAEKQFNPSVQFLTNNNEILFGGMNGFIFFSPKEFPGSGKIPDLAITSFKVLNEERILTNVPVDLNSNETSVSFQFAALDYNDPSKNQYRWMLEGYDNQYHYSYGNMRTAEYNHLSAGKYIFRVIGSNSYGLWSREVIIPIVIPPPIYLRWWFIGLAILIIITIPGFLIYLRIQNLIAIRKMKEKLSADLHDDIGSGLAEISLVADVLTNTANHENQDEQLSFISQRAREIVENMNDIVWLVNPKECSLTDVLIRLKNKCQPIIEALGMTSNFAIEEIPVNYFLSLEKKQNIYLIIKEAINNSIKYSKAKNIFIRISIEGKRLIISIIDDGMGFNLLKEQTGNGLRNMKKRASDIKAELVIHSSDISTHHGTSVIFSMNL